MRVVHAQTETALLMFAKARLDLRRWCVRECRETGEDFASAWARHWPEAQHLSFRTGLWQTRAALLAGHFYTDSAAMNN